MTYPIGLPPERRRRGKPRWFYPVTGGGLIVLSMILLAAALAYDDRAGEPRAQPSGESGLGTDDIPDPPPTTTTTTTVGTTTEPDLPPFDGWVNPASVGRPYGDTLPGLLTFRGNPTRTYYGEGPVPDAPEVLWRYPEGGGMCAESSGAQWCGTGWTGQAMVFERDDRTWVVFGAYDRGLHFLDGDTGEQIIPTFFADDIEKGSPTVDPDGYPIVYSGARDGFLRAIAFDRDEPAELWRWSAEAVSPTKWNNDWDASPLVLDDFLFQGGENSQFHIWALLTLMWVTLRPEQPVVRGAA